MGTQYINSGTTEVMIKSYYAVYNALGYGFLEKVYKNALYHELKSRGLDCKVEHPIKVYYDGRIVGEYFADIIVDDSIILELKACESLREEHELQLVNYLKATDIEIGLLLNFGKKPEVKRKIYLNDRKNRIINKQ
jgi:GxxExxY protein